MHPEVVPIPTRRVLEKLDEYLDRRDYPSAERHLKYWLSEAEIGKDVRGKLTVLNEQIGLYRKNGQQPEGMAAIQAALELLSHADFSDSVTAATTYINAATGYKAFGQTESAIPLYEKAKELYEKLLPDNDERLGGLYNNMAVSLTELGNYTAAEELYQKALVLMKTIPLAQGEMAVTYCNMADLVAKHLGLEKGEAVIAEYLETAYALLNASDLPQDGRHAFICEKCAPTFSYYGFFGYAAELQDRSRKIYERN